jgi:hypothetical protein
LRVACGESELRAKVKEEVLLLNVHLIEYVFGVDNSMSSSLLARFNGFSSRMTSVVVS